MQLNHRAALFFLLTSWWIFAPAARADEAAEVASLLREAQEDIQKVPIAERLELKIRLAEALARSGQQKAATNTYAECVQQIDVLVDKDKRDGWLFEISQAQSNTNDVLALLKTHGLVKDEGTRAEIWCSLCDGFCRVTICG